MPCVHLEPVRPFPPRLLAEGGAERFDPRVGGRALEPAARSSLLARIVDVVVRGVRLDRLGAGVLAIAVVRAEAAQVHAPHVHRRASREDPLGHHAADATGARDAVRAEAGGDEETPDVRCLAQDELAVWRERLRSVDQRDDLGAPDGRHA